MTSEVKKVILEIADEYDFPILASVDFGHYTPNIPLPLGLKASMDTEEANLSIDESYVK
jgi:muramoyltetrapeptide carboxypeptidase